MLGRCTNYGGGVGEMQLGAVSWARGASGDGTLVILGAVSMEDLLWSR
jgi:hypothetical protein